MPVQVGEARTVSRWIWALVAPDRAGTGPVGGFTESFCRCQGNVMDGELDPTMDSLDPFGHGPMHWDRQGNAISLRQWVKLRELPEHHIVARDEVGGITVSTVWVGLDLGYYPGAPPMIFETMIFGGPMDLECWRYPTEALALAGHAEVLNMVRLDAQVEQKE